MNSPNRALPSAPSNTLCVPSQMDEFSPGANASDLATDLQRLQRNVSGPLDSVLDWINDHFRPAPAIPRGRSSVPDTTTLLDASGSQLLTDTRVGLGQPMTLAILSSALTASMANATVFTVPLAVTAKVRGLAVTASANPSAGSGSVNVAGLTATITAGVTSTVPASATVAPSTALSGVLPIQVTTNSAFAMPSGSTVYVTIYLRWV